MAQTSHDFDVLISGGGLVGLTLALALDQGGLKAAVIDRLPAADLLEESFDGRATAMGFATYRMMQSLGVAGHIGEVQPIEQILVSDGRIGSPSHRGGPSSLTLHFDHRETGTGDEPLGWMIENRRIRLALDRQVATRSGITRFAPDEIEDLQIGAGQVSARLKSGKVLTAPVIVGADGRGSFVRKKAGIRTYGWSYDQTGIVTTVAMENAHQGVAHEYFLPTGPFAILPLMHNRANIVWSEKTSRAKALMAMSRADLEQELARRFGDFLGAVKLDAPVWSYPLSMELAATWAKPRVVLAGDAAHGIHPIAGQGLNLGLKDVAALAEVLVEARGLGQDLGDLAVLERYAQWRRTDTMTLAISCDAFVRLFSNDIAPVRALRTLGLGIVDAIGPARRFFASHAGGAVGDLPKLLRGENLGAPA
jgi:2-octaprenyl-6-methoxyphenol hydroxylase